tara:strand:- start:3286 stop:3498 length:213 start_codon:yes stop_codon:yes gene_type:complete
MKYSLDNVGESIEYEDKDGCIWNEKIVAVWCEICSAEYIGPINQAGGFLARHDFFHTWEFKQETMTELTQ